MNILLMKVHFIKLKTAMYIEFNMYSNLIFSNRLLINI